MPWFDVRFRGYGRNKIVFTAALNASGFTFEVPPPLSAYLPARISLQHFHFLLKTHPLQHQSESCPCTVVPTE